jgi:hypothetical protein
MRYAAVEKLEIIRTVEDSSLGIKRTLWCRWAFPSQPFTTGMTAT